LRAEDPLAIAHENAGPYLVSTTAIAIENTHNFGGGTVQPIDEIAVLSRAARARGIAMHLDGARIWNANIASGVSFAEYGKHFDTISVCLSKGLGAPIGSVMLSDKSRVADARIWRKRYGAGMRQVGIIAAAGHYALDNNIKRLAEDHARAKKLAQALHTVNNSIVDPAKVQTNIVGLDLVGMGMTAAELTSRCKEAGLWISALGPHYARLVTHLDFDDEQCDQAIEILQRALVAK
jgi:threonine aldolase